MTNNNKIQQQKNCQQQKKPETYEFNLLTCYTDSEITMSYVRVHGT